MNRRFTCLSCMICGTVLSFLLIFIKLFIDISWWIVALPYLASVFISFVWIELELYWQYYLSKKKNREGN